MIFPDCMNPVNMLATISHCTAYQIVGCDGILQEGRMTAGNRHDYPISTDIDFIYSEGGAKYFLFQRGRLRSKYLRSTELQQQPSSRLEPRPVYMQAQRNDHNQCSPNRPYKRLRSSP